MLHGVPCGEGVAAHDNGLHRVIPRSVDGEIQTGTSGGNAEAAALATPFEGQCADAPEALGGQLDRLAAGEGGFDDVRSQESELDIAPDVARVDPIAPGNLLDGPDFSSRQLIEPATRRATRAIRFLYQGALLMTHRDGFPRLSARSAWRGDARHRKPCGTPSESPGPQDLGKPPFRSGGRTGSGRIGAGVGKP